MAEFCKFWLAARDPERLPAAAAFVLEICEDALLTWACSALVKQLVEGLLQQLVAVCWACVHWALAPVLEESVAELLAAALSLEDAFFAEAERVVSLAEMDFDTLWDFTSALSVVAEPSQVSGRDLASQ